MVNFFTQICPKNPCKVPSNLTIHPSPYCFTVIRGQFEQNVTHSRMQAEKKPSTKELLKEHDIQSIKMPGFIHPCQKYAEGCFTQEAKAQIEKLKTQMDGAKVESAKKEE